MKLLDSKLIQKPNRRHYGKYRMVLLVTDVDIDMLEDLATCYCTKAEKPECEFKDEYRQWLKKTFRQFHKLWVKYDEQDSSNIFSR